MSVWHKKSLQITSNNASRRVMYINYIPPVFCSYYVPMYVPVYGPYYHYGYYPGSTDIYYSSPMTPITDWISANKGDSPLFRGGLSPFAGPYYSSPLVPLGDWISANKYHYASFGVPTFWGFGFSSRDMSFASFGDTLWYRSAGLTFFDSPWGMSWEFEPLVIARHEVPKQSGENS